MPIFILLLGLLIQQHQSNAHSAPVLILNAGSHNDPSRPPQKKAGAAPVVAEDDVIKVDTTVVNVPVSVMERDGKYVANLRKEDFRIFEDGVEQQLAYFASIEKPFTVALMLDISDSTERRLAEIQQAAIAFVDQLRPDDQVLVVSFDSRINILSEPTGDRAQLRQAIQATRTGQGTRLYDALDFVINHRFNSIPGRKAIVLFTDGVDLNSKVQERATVRDLEEADVMVYPVRFETENDVREKLSAANNPSSPAPMMVEKGSRHEDYVHAANYLETISTSTGGRLYSASSRKSIAQAFALIAEALRWQYSLGYYPQTHGEPGQRHKVKVKVNRANVALRARDSYVRRSK